METTDSKNWERLNQKCVENDSKSQEIDFKKAKGTDKNENCCLKNNGRDWVKKIRMSQSE